MKNELLEDLTLLVRNWIAYHSGDDMDGHCGPGIMKGPKVTLVTGEVIDDSMIEGYLAGGVVLTRFDDGADGSSLIPRVKVFIPYGQIRTIEEPLK